MRPVASVRLLAEKTGRPFRRTTTEVRTPRAAPPATSRMLAVMRVTVRRGEYRIDETRIGPGLTLRLALAETAPACATTRPLPPRPSALTVVVVLVFGLTTASPVGLIDQPARAESGFPNASAPVTPNRRDPRGPMAAEPGSTVNFERGPGATVSTCVAVVTPSAVALTCGGPARVSR